MFHKRRTTSTQKQKIGKNFFRTFRNFELVSIGGTGYVRRATEWIIPGEWCLLNCEWKLEPESLNSHWKKIALWTFDHDKINSEELTEQVILRSCQLQTKPGFHITMKSSGNPQSSLLNCAHRVPCWMLTNSRRWGEFWVQDSPKHHPNYKQKNKQHWDDLLFKTRWSGVMLECSTTSKFAYICRLWDL